MQLLSFRIQAESNIATVLDRIDRFAAKVGAAELARHEVSTIVSEIAYNLVKYTPGGVIEVNFDEDTIRIDACDEGSGISMGLQRAFDEGISTGGSLGLGMPTLVRLSDHFSIVNGPSGVRIRVTKRCK